MMYTNDSLPNIFQLLYDKICVLESKVDELSKQIGITKEELPEDDFITVETAADYLRMSRSSIYQLTSRIEIPCMKKGKRLYFKKEELRQWLEEGSNKPSSKQEKQAIVLSHLRPRKKKLK